MRSRVNRPRGLRAVVLLFCLSLHGCASEALAPGLTKSRFDALAQGSTPDEVRKQIGTPLLEAVQVTKDDVGPGERVHWFYGTRSSWRGKSYSVPVVTFVSGKLVSRAWDSAAFDALDKSLVGDETAQ